MKRWKLPRLSRLGGVLRAAGIGCAVMFCATPVATVASAADDAWRFKVVAKLSQIQSRASCFSVPKSSAYVHVLGVQPSAIALTPARQAKLVSALSETILANTANRVTVAREFSTIATRSVSFSEARIREITKLTREAEAADITVVLQPIGQVANRLDLQVTIWANDSTGDGPARVSCVTPFSTAVTFEDDADPQCARAWRQAELRDTVSGYRGFMDFFPDCAQASDARARIAAADARVKQQQKSATCAQAFAATRAAASLSAYKTFVVDHFSCPQVEGARVAMRVLQDLANANAAKTVPGGGYTAGGENADTPRPTSPLETCVRKANLGEYCVSSVLASSDANASDYGPRSLFDGSDRTGWAEGVSGSGEGEWVVIAFERPTKISGLFLKNGFAKSRRLFKRNGALRTVDIRLSNGATFRRKVANHTRFQWLRFDSSEVTWVQMRIGSVRKGTRHADTVINELRPILQ
ncbi:MAG: discoidin domain-containing protein [Pseudomonadota bacterium]